MTSLVAEGLASPGRPETQRGRHHLNPDPSTPCIQTIALKYERSPWASNFYHAVHTQLELQLQVAWPSIVSSSITFFKSYCRWPDKVSLHFLRHTVFFWFLFFSILKLRARFRIVDVFVQPQEPGCEFNTGPVATHLWIPHIYDAAQRTVDAHRYCNKLCHVHMISSGLYKTLGKNLEVIKFGFMNNKT